MKLIRTEDAVGHVLCHDMTQIIKDKYKDARFCSCRPCVRKTACIVATGGEVKSGLIRDTFTPVVIEKLKTCGIETLEIVYSGDGVENVRNAVLEMRARKPDMIFCTGGMSVNPDDNTPRRHQGGRCGYRRLRRAGPAGRDVPAWLF